MSEAVKFKNFINRSVWYCMTINLAIGLVTPLVGNCLFIASTIAKTDIFTVFKGSLPFLLCNIFVLFLVNLFPAVSMFLPNLLFK